MTKTITLILLSMLILSGCGQGNTSDPKLSKEIAELKEENESLKDKISLLEGNETKETEGEKAGDLTSEIGINETRFIKDDYDNPIDMTYTIQKYGYLETIGGYGTYGDEPRTTDGKFLVLEAHIENTGKKESRADRYCFVTDDQDREYECTDVKIFDKENEDPISQKN